MGIAPIHPLRLAAFTDDPTGGNPAGVVLDAGGLDPGAMLRIAGEVGFSETAFLSPRGAGRYDVRFFSPEAEVPFCGHATVAAAVQLGDGEHVFSTMNGDVPVSVADGRATLTSVPPHVEELADEEVGDALRLLGWRAGELDPALPPRIAFAGARHLVLAAATRARLAKLHYDFDGLRRFMLRHDLTTVHLVWREDATTFHARDPFPVGGVVEDPATGAAAAAFGGYLRALGIVKPPARLLIRQGEDMRRPSRILVELDAEDPRVRVSGSAVVLEEPRFREAAALK